MIESPCLDAEQSNNNEPPGYVFANVAVELKKPLTALTEGNKHTIAVFKEVRAQLIDMPDVPDHLLAKLVEAEKNLENTANLSHFMKMSINRCIDYSRLKENLALDPNMTTVNVADALKLPVECVASLNPHQSIRLLPLPSDLCTHIIADAQWLQENVLCLLSNAVKYSSRTADPTRDGHITLSVNLRTVDALRKECSAPTGEDPSSLTMHSSSSFSAEERVMLVVEVEDCGFGLSEQRLSQLFAPSSTAARLTSGTGLGLLSLSKRMEALNGLCGVRARRDLTTGCLFWFAIPYIPDELTADLVNKSVFSPQDSNSSTIGDNANRNSSSSMATTELPYNNSDHHDHTIDHNNNDIDLIQERISNEYSTSYYNPEYHNNNDNNNNNYSYGTNHHNNNDDTSTNTTNHTNTNTTTTASTATTTNTTTSYNYLNYPDNDAPTHDLLSSTLKNVLPSPMLFETDDTADKFSQFVQFPVYTKKLSRKSLRSTMNALPTSFTSEMHTPIQKWETDTSMGYDSPSNSNNNNNNHNNSTSGNSGKSGGGNHNRLSVNFATKSHSNNSSGQDLLSSVRSNNSTIHMFSRSDSDHQTTTSGTTTTTKRGSSTRSLLLGLPSESLSSLSTGNNSSSSGGNTDSNSGSANKSNRFSLAVPTISTPHTTYNFNADTNPTDTTPTDSITTPNTAVSINTSNYNTNNTTKNNFNDTTTTISANHSNTTTTNANGLPPFATTTTLTNNTYTPHTINTTTHTTNTAYQHTPTTTTTTSATPPRSQHTVEPSPASSTGSPQRATFDNHNNTWIPDCISMIRTHIYTVLLVDDTPMILKMTKLMLQRQGFDVTTAQDGAEALALIQSSKRFDVVLMDLQMPILNGLEAARKIRAKEQATGCENPLFLIAVSANSDPMIVLETVSAGFDNYIEKPFTVVQFESVLTKYLAKKLMY